METGNLGLSHRPLGIEHPYHQDPDERFPRSPLAGQPVSLGARTWPPGAARRVWAAWTEAAEQVERLTEAVLTERGSEAVETMIFATSVVRQGGGPPGDTWRVDLPPFAAGQRITYRLHAAGDAGLISSPEHAFSVLAWSAAGAPRRCSLSGDRVAIRFPLAGERVISLSFWLAGADQIDFRLSAEQPEAAPPAASPISQQVAGQGEAPFVLVNGPLRLEINLHPYRLRLTRNGKELLATSAAPECLFGGGREPIQAVRLSFDSPADEGFFGLGERFHAFNQRGTAPDVLLYEQYKNQGIHTYIPVPFLLSSRGYAFYLRTARCSNFDLAANHPERWTCTAELGDDETISGRLYAAASPLENLRLNSRQVGLPEMPPEWAFGPWMSSNEWNSQAIVMEQARLAQEHDIPATVLVIEAWSDENTFYIWNDARYQPKSSDQPLTLQDFTFPPEGRWPDPKAMIDGLHRQGIRLLLWQIPIMKFLGGEQHAQKDIDEEHMLRMGYHLRWQDGSPYRVRPFWFHDSLLLDATNPDAVDWWMAKRAYLLDELGVDGFKTDGGEHLWGRDVIFANGMRGDEGQNLYPNLYVGAYYRFARQKRGGDALTFSRAGFTGAQAFPCHWAGDENSTWEAFRASLCAGLNAGISGIPFWGWDIAGFSGEVPSAELYLRSAGMAVFCPVMQYHSEYNDHRRPLRDRTPWNIAERTGQPEVIDVYRKYAQLRMRLLPYICTEARTCAETGEPLMRPLFLDWPGDPQAWQVEDQYCFGRALLVAPVLQPGAAERRLYLPDGEWVDFWDGRPVAGGQWLTVAAPLDRIPVYRRLDRPWPA